MNSALDLTDNSLNITELCQIKIAKILAQEQLNSPHPGLELKTIKISNRPEIGVIINWKLFNGNNFFWRKTVDSQPIFISSNEGDCFLLLVLGAIPKEMCTIPELQEELQLFIPWLLSGEHTFANQSKTPLTAALELPLARLRQRLAMWLNKTNYEPWGEMLSRAFGHLTVSAHAIRNNACTRLPQQTWFSSVKLLGLQHKTIPEIPQFLSIPCNSYTMTEEIQFILSDQRIGVFTDPVWYGIYLPAYIDMLWDCRISLPILNWEDYINLKKLDWGLPIPENFKTELCGLLRNWFLKGKKRSQTLLAATWDTFKTPITYSNFCVVGKKTDLVEKLIVKDQVLVGNIQDKPVVPRKKTAFVTAYAKGLGGTVTGNFRWYVSKRGVFIAPEDFYEITLDIVKNSFIAERNLDFKVRGNLLKSANIDSIIEKDFKSWCLKVEDQDFIHLTVFLEYLISKNTALYNFFRTEFNKSREELLASKLSAVASRKRLEGKHIRAVFPFSLNEDKIIWEINQSRATQYQWLHIQAKMSRHALYRIQSRVKFFLFCKRQLKCTMEEARTPEFLEKALRPRLKKRFATMFLVE